MAEMFKKLNDDLATAMKAKDSFRLDVIRMMKSKVLNVNARGDLPDVEVIKIFQKYAKSLKDAIEETKKVNRPEAVGKLEKELKIVEEYLPKMLSEAEVMDIVAKAIIETGAASPKETGKVMKAVMGKGFNVDGSVVSRLVSEALKKGA
ncbi:MAG: GatB/YqeY domain-containing protein [bacterium]